ncbi:uncharacterized protein DUF5057 [Mobilisporobacter senegalensis]|uniref:Uncharacterized protein DUF5057 n=1 Tax=Mobilisporobacter senegalensis TaxID=1329262 RepID=A0A3N1XVJ4_9FIRM|nr:DUF5057 domain-containing protein [Mobilisporobacter senegalensis]ROR30644.1 uncharacterized protein DUF5057 [Mobilisporobacter senegalensis]
MKKNNGKNKKRRIVSHKGIKLSIGCIIFAAFLFTMPQIITWVQAAVITHGEAVNDIIPGETGEKGTKQNPFVILEIVPYEGYAEIGYLIEGCEPVDMEKVRYSGDMTTVTAALASTAEWGVRKQFPDEKGIPSSWTAVNENVTLYGYYEKVADNKGVFREAVNSATGEIDYIKVGENQGNIIWKTIFKKNISVVEKKRKLTAIGEKVYMYRTDNQYKQGYAYTYDHKHQFLKEVLEVPEKQIPNYEIMVKTVEPKDLNNQLDWIDRADLISISPKSHIAGLPEVWGKYNLAGKSYQGNHSTDFSGNDLSWAAVVRIFKKVNIAEDYAGMIFDWGVYTNPPASTSRSGVISYQINYDGKITGNGNAAQKGNRNNVYKLALMSRTMNPVLFYNLFLNESQGTPLIQDGSYTIQPNSNAKQYWTQSTFMFSQKDGSLAWDTHWNELWDKYQLNPNMGDNVSVSGRIYSYNGDNSLSQNFASNTIAATKFTEEFRDYISKKGLTSTPAHAVRYILGPQNKEPIRNRDMKVLELQPTKDFGLTPFTVRTMFPRCIGKIDIVSMTSAEFVGKIEDLNSTYDMIYMGMNYGEYNTRSRVSSDNKSWPQNLKLPDYNDNNLDGKIYLHVGDKITGDRHGVNWITEILPKTEPYENRTARMPGNDITKSKMKHLEEFIEAGYPVLVEPMLYNTGTDLTDLVVDKTSNIYSLIRNKKSKVNVMNAENLPSNTPATGVVWSKPILQIDSSPKAYVGTSSDGKIADSNYINSENINYRNLNFKYTILDEDDSKRFDVKLFIDANSDGRFDEETELNMIQRGMTPNVSHNFTKRLARDYFGVIPWKLQIVDTGNPNNRDEVSGTSAVKRTDSDKERIKVLQVNQTNSSTLSLAGNAVFETYTKNLNDFVVKFETVTIADFQGRYAGSKYFNTSTEETKKNTDQLKEYNMLILGFNDTYGPITNESARNNIQYFIEKGKSVLFTHDITSFNNASNQSGSYGYYFNRDFRDILGMDRFGIRNPGKVLKDYNDLAISPSGARYSQKHGYTYYSLIRMADNGQKLTYKDLTPTDNALETTTVTKLNSGQITQYPYAIDDTIPVANTHGQYFQLNLDDPGIVVWYCLGKGLNDVYGKSPNDAANNYYIYNKGNITYSGVGHSKVGGSIMEVKLFVNTMIAAYRASIEEPMIEIVNEEECIFIPGEEYGENEYLEIEFIPWDFNLSSQELGVKVNIKDSSELEIYDKFGNKMNQIFTSKDGKRLLKLENGNTYTARYKRSLFSDVNLRTIEFYIENKGGFYGDEELKLKERVLFNLY